MGSGAREHSDAVDIGQLKAWQGRQETRSDSISPWLVAAFRATLDEEPSDPAPGEPAPLGLHWCLALPAVPNSALGPDGHPARGGFLPPVPLPRRMWAGGRLAFSDSLRVGDRVTRTSLVTSVEFKEGRSGQLVFVVVEHRFSTERGLAITEEHDIVYRGLDGAPAPPTERPVSSPPGASPAVVRRRIEPSPVLLFRYSALTFNGHRIHYDRPYVETVERYPGLIVHGPLQATLLMLHGRRLLDAPIGLFSFRAERPLFDLAPFDLEGSREGDGVALRVLDSQGRITMRATARA